MLLPIFYLKIYLSQCISFFFQHTNSAFQFDYTHQHCYDLLKKPYTLEGFEPGSSVSEGDEMSTAPCRQGKSMLLFQSSDLHFSWIGAESFDENGNAVTDFNASAAFVVNEISGDVFVVGGLDRELVDRVKLFVAVEDFAAETSQQVTQSSGQILSSWSQYPAIKGLVPDPTITEFTTTTPLF
jgi:hypothetical protein